MWCEWMDEFEESEREEMKRIKEEMELKDKIFRISHPVLAKLNDAKMQLGRKILGLQVIYMKDWTGNKKTTFVTLYFGFVWGFTNSKFGLLDREGKLQYEQI